MPPVAGEQDANITVETATGYVNVAFVSLGIVRFPHCYIPTANQKPLPSDIKEKPVLLKFETHAQCLSLQLHITLLNELNAMGNVA